MGKDAPYEGTREPDLLFYDGGCGLCHRAVLFVLRRDPKGESFRFAPLQGITYLQRLSEADRAGLPDSLVVLAPQGRVFTRSSAALRILRRLSHPWRGLGGLLGLVPRPLRDLAYDAIARARKRLFEAPKGACPRVSEGLRTRFLP